MVSSRTVAVISLKSSLASSVNFKLPKYIVKRYPLSTTFSLISTLLISDAISKLFKSIPITVPTASNISESFDESSN